MSKKIKKLKKLLPFSVLMVAPLIVFPASNFIEKDYKNNEQDTKHITLNYNFGGQWLSVLLQDEQDVFVTTFQIDFDIDVCKTTFTNPGVYSLSYLFENHMIINLSISTSPSCYFYTPVEVQEKHYFDTNLKTNYGEAFFPCVNMGVGKIGFEFDDSNPFNMFTFNFDGQNFISQNNYFKVWGLGDWTGRRFSKTLTLNSVSFTGDFKILDPTSFNKNELMTIDYNNSYVTGNQPISRSSVNSIGQLTFINTDTIAPKAFLVPEPDYPSAFIEWWKPIGNNTPMVSCEILKNSDFPLQNGTYTLSELIEKGYLSYPTFNFYSITALGGQRSLLLDSDQSYSGDGATVTVYKDSLTKMYLNVVNNNISFSITNQFINSSLHVKVQCSAWTYENWSVNDQDHGQGKVNTYSFNNFLDPTTFNKNALQTLDYANSYADTTNSYLDIKFNDDYIAADLMAWDTQKNQVTGSKDGSGNYDTSIWTKIPALKNYAAQLAGKQWALNDISNAIINGKLINQECPNAICTYTIPNTSRQPMNEYIDESSNFSLMYFLINHSHDDQKTMETYLSGLPTLKWKSDINLFGVDITSALSFDNYDSLISDLLSQDLSYTLTYLTADNTGSQKTKTFTLKDLVAGEQILTFVPPDSSTTWFKLLSCTTSSGTFGAIGLSDTLGIYDTQHKDPDGKIDPKVYSLDGQETNTFTFTPPQFELSRALDETSDKGDMFYGPTGLSDNQPAWLAFKKILYTQTPSQILSYIDAGKVPNSLTGMGDINFDKTCFFQVDENFKSEYSFDNIVNTLTWAANDSDGTLKAHIIFQDESSGDQAQDITINLFAKQVAITKHTRTKPLSIEPSQLTEQDILDNRIKYADSPTIINDDDDPYLYETNLTKAEFQSCYKGMNLKVQDDNGGDLDVIFKLYNVCYQMDTGASPTVTAFEINDTDFTPLKPPKSGSSLVWLWCVLGVVGVGAVGLITVKLKKNKNKFKTADDEENEEIENEKKWEAKRHTSTQLEKEEIKDKNSSSDNDLDAIGGK